MEKKKLFISADIEGTCSVLNWKETEYGGEGYEWARTQMTREVSAAAKGALARGYEVTVKDAHDSARNLLPDELEPGARLIRGWMQNPWCMMAGIQLEDYSAAAYTGYHSDAFCTGNPLSHTMDTIAQRVYLNGKPASEFILNAYAAALRGIPSVFLSGDEALCESAAEWVPGIVTAPTKSGFGAAVCSPSPAEVCRRITTGIASALMKLDARTVDKSSLLPPPCGHFVLDIEYKEHWKAERFSYYPGAERTDAKTLRYENDDYYEILRAIHFIL